MFNRIALLSDLLIKYLGSNLPLEAFAELHEWTQESVENLAWLDSIRTPSNLMALMVAFQNLERKNVWNKTLDKIPELRQQFDN